MSCTCMSRSRLSLGPIVVRHLSVICEVVHTSELCKVLVNIHTSLLRLEVFLYHTVEVVVVHNLDLLNVTSSLTINIVVLKSQSPVLVASCSDVSHASSIVLILVAPKSTIVSIAW